LNLNTENGITQNHIGITTHALKDNYENCKHFTHSVIV